jgi:hypothetical protein
MPNWTGCGGNPVAVGCEPQLAKVPSVMGEYDPVLVGGVLAVAGADVIDSHAVLLLTPTQYEKPTLKPKVQLTLTDGFHSKKLSAVIRTVSRRTHSCRH